MKIEIPDLDFSDDSRGVSPVIGVILMVAITVILAAVIGAFVLDLGSNLGQTGPTSQLTISDNTPNNQEVTLEHKGGDDLQKSNLVIKTSPSGSATIASGAPTEITVGDKVTITGLPSGASEVTITVVHKPSNSVLLETTVENP